MANFSPNVVTLQRNQKYKNFTKHLPLMFKLFFSLVRHLFFHLRINLPKHFLCKPLINFIRTRNVLTLSASPPPPARLCGPIFYAGISVKMKESGLRKLGSSQDIPSKLFSQIWIKIKSEQWINLDDGGASFDIRCYIEWLYQR